ncbi:MAG: hypothetical protein KDC87_21805 [Planctomycetes bacterium]|nr:hypothetical protein [Planctomycetota bacterium]MCB9870784.1 hypothetical protein [Planctomycetota bacterium]MCB9872364.1 hypothetical protein [Planctomycetota bacterium]
MTPAHHPFLRRPLLLVLIGLLASCATSSTTFIENHPDYSVSRGRIVRLEHLYSEKILPLADGVVFAVSRPDCRVALELPGGERRLLELAPPAMVLCGTDRDYVLEPVRGGAPATGKADPAKAPQPTKAERR